MLKEKLLNTNYFINNEWLNKYCQLITDNKNTVRESGVTQSHHILQKAYFKLTNQPIDNSKNNLVNLKYSDHILAHYYLCYCTLNELKKKNYHALHSMICCNNQTIDNLELFIKENIDNYNSWYNDYIRMRSQEMIDGFNPTKGRKRTQQEKKIKSGVLKTITYKKVICVNTNKIYDSVNEAAKEFNVHPSSIRDAINNTGHSSNLCWQYYEDWLSNPLDISTVKFPSNKKSVLCIETKKSYDSFLEASRQTKIDNSSISKCCRGKRKTAGGYHWKYL